MMHRLVWAVILSSVAVSLAQPTEWMLGGNPLLALVGWVPLFWALKRAQSVGQASLLGALFGFLTTVFQNYWLAFFRDYALLTAGSVSLALAGYFALLAPFLWVMLRRPEPWRAFAVGALWAVFEFLKSNGFLGFPWGLAPYPFHGVTWFIQICDITGLSFLAFLVISWNAWLGEQLEERPLRDWSFLTFSQQITYKRMGRPVLIFFLVITAGLAVYGFYRLGENRPQRGSAKLVLVQQNADPWNGGDDLGPLRTSVRLSKEGLKSGNIDLVVWSETSLRLPLQGWRPFYERNPPDSPLLKTIRANRVWWLFGNPYAQDLDWETGEMGGLVNATVLMNPQAQIVDYYGKIQQVPIAEYIPYWDVPAVQSFFKNVVGLPGSWSLGRQMTVFKVPVSGKQTMSFSTPICFEIAFAWVNRAMVQKGAEVLINLTDNSWSKQNSSQVQLQLTGFFRAVETRTSVVNSTNSGVTCVISPTGQMAAGPLPYFKEGQLTAEVPLYKDRVITPYVQFGDVLVYAAVGFLFLDLVFRSRRLSRGKEA